MKKVLFVATVKEHIMAFHLPYLKLFHDKGWTVHVATNEGKNKSIIPYCDQFYNVSFERNPFKTNNVIAYRFLKKVMTENQYDIVHCHTPVGGVLARLAGKQCLNTRMIYTAHGFHFYNGASLLNWLLYYPVERICAHYTDILITINHEDYQRAKHFTLHDGGKVYYVPGVGIDTHQINEININRETKCKELGISPDTFIILSVGELNKNKNHEIVIRAIAQMDCKNVHYVIAGKGNLEESLKALSVEWGIAEQVHVLGYRTDVKELYKIADVFVHPSYREGLPVAVMEAMASGLPIVCSDIRGNRDLVINNKNGYLISSNNISEYSEKIDELLNNKEKCNKFSAASLEMINKFNINHVKEMMEKIYAI